MRTFELRVYKLRTEEALDSYTEQAPLLNDVTRSKVCLWRNS
jgi:hypothetical protein